MIRVGQVSKFSWAADRVAAASGGMAAILVFAWLFRGVLSLEAYTYDILLATIVLVFVALIFKTRTNSGAARSISGFLSNLTLASIVAILLTWFLQWIDAKGVPSTLAALVPDFAILALAAGLGAFAAHQFRPRGQPVVSAPLFVIRAGDGPSMGDAKVTAKRDSVAAAVKRSGRIVGCVVLGDLQASFNTPMGTVSASLAGPATSTWVSFEGEKLGTAEAQRMTGKTSNQLLEEARTNASLAPPFGVGKTVDLPFIHIEEDGVEEVTEEGPISVRKDGGREHVRVGPITIDSDDTWRGSGAWCAKGAGDTYFKGRDGATSAKWNGSSLSFDRRYMKLSCGSDSFTYTPAEITTESPLHSLRVTQDKVSLDTRKFTLKVSGNTVVLRAEDKTQTTDSKDFAGDIRTTLTEAAKRQVKGLMEGVPVDLSEMLDATEEALARHG